MTEAEKKLWERLRAKRFYGLKFRRQHIIDPYITDFCCISKKIIIEVDGGIHSKRRKYDEERDNYLRECGYITLRFPNDRILDNIEMILAIIRESCRLDYDVSKVWDK